MYKNKCEIKEFEFCEIKQMTKEGTKSSIVTKKTFNLNFKRKNSNIMVTQVVIP